MSAETRLKQRIKPMLFAADAVPRVVRFGPARGVSFYLSRIDGIQREFGLYETEISPVYREVAPTAGVMYDVGASDGYTTLLLSNLSPGGRVVAFEPDPQGLKSLHRNLDLNPAVRDRVTVVPMALGSGGPSGPDFPAHVGLDELVHEERIPPPDFIKVDVEGAEVEVLTGALTVMKEHFPPVLVETHSLQLENEVCELLESAGYIVTIIGNAPWRIVWPETRPAGHNRWLVGRPRRQPHPAG